MFENKYNSETETRETMYNPIDEKPANEQPPKKKNGKIKKIFKTVALICCIALISVGSIAAYKYVDENGVPFISDKSLKNDDSENYKEEKSKDDNNDSKDNNKENKSTIDRSKYKETSLLELAKGEDAMSTQAIYQKVMPSVVGIASSFEYESASYDFWGYENNSDTETVEGTGTGIIMSADGYMLTNAHVIFDGQYGQASSVSVRMHDETEYDAEVVGYDVQTDIAVLKVDAKDLKPAQFGESGSLEVGDAALAIGNPLGFDLFGTLTVGYISGLGREIAVNDTTMKLIQTDAAINSGNSGGPLINDSGQVVGINSMKMSSSYSSASVEGLGFAIPIDEAKKIIDDLMAYGYVTGRPQLGITYKDLSAGAASYYTQGKSSSSGVMVTDVNQDGPADKAGIEPGDIIVGADGELITGIDELKAAISKYSTGDKIRLTIIRDRSYYDIDVTLDDKVSNNDNKK